MLKTHFGRNEVLLVEGYSREIFGYFFIPDIVIHIIALFSEPKYQIHSSESGTTDINSNNIQNPTNIHVNGLSTFYTTSNDVLYVYGNNSYGQLGIGHWAADVGLKSHPIFYDIKYPKCISFGIYNFHCFVSTKDNKLYGFGRNDKNQLGIHTDTDILCKNKDICEPILVDYKFDDIIKQISCGNLYTIFLVNNGNIYGCGSNEYGQLSFSNFDKYYYINKINNINNIQQIGCSNNTTYLLNNNNELFSFGCNAYGQMGIYQSDIKRTNKITKIQNFIVQQFDVGYHHLGFLNHQNNAFMFGSNQFSECGVNNNNKIIYAPYKIDACNGNGINVRCGNSHTIIKCNTNNGYKYYIFGCNLSNQCFMNNIDIPILSEPYLIDSTKITIPLPDYTIIDFIPGYDTTYIIVITNKTKEYNISRYVTKIKNEILDDIKRQNATKKETEISKEIDPNFRITGE